jgi:pyridinium-3,5-biscarboxylic acid mononucleotide synthase
MDELLLHQLLVDVSKGDCDPDEAVRRLRHLPFADLGFARVDHHRALRQGFAEAVYGPGKSPEQCASIVVELLRAAAGPVLLTRADPHQVAAARQAAAGAAVSPASDEDGAREDGAKDRGESGEEALDEAHPRDDGEAVVTPTGSLSTVAWRRAPRRPGRVLVLTAGTADLPVADECRAVLDALGFSPSLIADCGVAGVHRLLASVEELQNADVVVVVAGMEGALASLVGGITAAPVVAVPTSVGYGASLEGVTALLAMLASCAAGVTVVGIDNGYGAACAVARMLR